MSDNTTLQSTTLATPPAGLVVAGDDIGGALYQRVKLTWGSDGVATDASTGSPIPVTVTSLATSTGTIGSVLPSSQWTVTTTPSSQITASVTPTTQWTVAVTSSTAVRGAVMPSTQWTVSVTPTTQFTVTTTPSSQITASVTPTSKVDVTQVPASSGGLGIRYKSLGITVSPVSTAPCQLYGWHIYNSNSSAAYIQLTNATTGSVTIGSPTMSIGIPATSGANVHFGSGIEFSSALSMVATAGATSTSSNANNVEVNFFYK